MKKTCVLIACLMGLALTSSLYAQEYIRHTFRGTRVVNGHALDSQLKGELDLIIAHRFGRINGGAYELFGLDQADMRIGLEYGFSDWVAVGAGRSSVDKTYDGFLKLRMIRQGAEGGSPISMTYVGGIALRTLRDNDPIRELYYTNNLYYSHQLLLGSRISDRFSFQLMPSLLHRNYTESIESKNDVFAMGIATRFRMTKTLAITLEYYRLLPNQLPEQYHNSLGIGFELETGGHVFQLHFTNSRGMTERYFIGETTGDFWKGDIHFGFNMSRTFKIKGRWF